MRELNILSQINLPENSERSVTDSALLAVCVSDHPHVGVVTQAGLEG